MPFVTPITLGCYRFGAPDFGDRFRRTYYGQRQHRVGFWSGNRIRVRGDARGLDLQYQPLNESPDDRAYLLSLVGFTTPSLRPAVFCTLYATET